MLSRFESSLLHKDGREVIIETSGMQVLDENGNYFGWRGVNCDIIEREQAEQKIRQQAEEILELSTPVIQVWEGVVIAPLIGTLDSQRTQGLMERFLNSIVETKSPVALVDITGVPTVDTQTAQHLMEAISAARLLGTKVVLTGVRPVIAQTLVHLGIDLSEIETCASLAAGLRLALDMLNLEIVDNKLDFQGINLEKRAQL